MIESAVPPQEPPGDEAEFRRLVERHRRELYAHFYRMLGSVQDAEDALQETLLAAWRGLAGFEGRSSLRTWIFRVATTAGPRGRAGAAAPALPAGRACHGGRGGADAHAAVAELKRRPGADILMFGSRTLWNDLLAAGLVDELHLMVGTAVLGGGTPAFGTGPVPPLRLLETRRSDGSDNVILRYAVTGRGE